MSLIKSISGIRGTIGGEHGKALTPVDVVKFTAAFSVLIKRRSNKAKPLVIIGRDARISGEMVSKLVAGTLLGTGIDVADLGLSTTPTVEIAVMQEKASGGIIITASHNPKQWNALKLLNKHGEFISASDGKELLRIAEKEDFDFVAAGSVGDYKIIDGYIDKHIDKILALPLVDAGAIQKSKLKIVVDAVNSTGGIAVPKLLKALGVEKVIELYCEPSGHFQHNPEPLPENLVDLSREVVKNKAHLGLSVDPDVDRLAIVCEDGGMFGEEYTLVAVADYILKNKKGNTVSNMSSTYALRDITEKAGQKYYASAVGEVNVVEMMKEKKAVIGGEGNGGVIYPELHYGRDALVGIALFLTHLVKSGKICSMLRESYPDYYISKNKIELTPEIDVDKVLADIKKKYSKHPVSTIDGIKIEFDKEWVHLRRSNTEPIIRIYAESGSATGADHLAQKIIADIKDLVKKK